LALEEPEAHLHPDAIHKLKKNHRRNIKKTPSNHHNTLSSSGNKGKISSNIIIKDSSAKAAKSVSELRNCLGVRVSDNLHSAYLMLIVEGYTDQIILRHILSSISPDLAVALNNEQLAIDFAGRSGNIPYKVSWIKSMLLQAHVVVDNDEAGRQAITKMTEQNFINNNEYNILICPGMVSSEIEDCLNLELYKEFIKNDYGVNLNVPEFRSTEKWSQRIKKCFVRQGKLFDEKIEARIKVSVANLVTDAPFDPLCPGKGFPIRELAATLGDRLSRRSSASPTPASPPASS
jgi:predicted ATP-dependent endonuclease of OLD family